VVVTALVVELGKIAERVQDQATNENSVYRGQPILEETSRGVSLDELRERVVRVRQEMVDSTASLPPTAFETQPLDADGNPIWSAGEVVTHCNGVLMRFVEQAGGMIGIDAPTWSDEQAASGEQRALDKAAAVAAADLIDLSGWLAAIPSGADLESSVDHPAFGKLSGRAWLHFIAVHEANHVEQLEELRAAHS
jgi:DinB superfamily